MSKLTLETLLTFLMMSFILMMASPSSSSWGAEARYLPTRSDPLSPVGPPRGEDPRFDRLYDIIREVIFSPLFSPSEC